MATPYTTKSGLKIGSAYVKYPRPSMDADAQLLQQALLTSDEEKASRAELRLSIGMTITLVVVVVLLAVGWL